VELPVWSSFEKYFGNLAFPTTTRPVYLIWTGNLLIELTFVSEKWAKVNETSFRKFILVIRMFLRFRNSTANMDLLHIRLNSASQQNARMPIFNSSCLPFLFSLNLLSLIKCFLSEQTPQHEQKVVNSLSTRMKATSYTSSLHVQCCFF